MSEEKVLTKEIAEQFLQDHESVDLDDFATISEAAAEILIKFDGDMGYGQGSLNIDGLKSISKSVAEILSQCKGSLMLGGEKNEFMLTDEVLEIFSTHAGEYLYLGISELSDAGAQSLSKHKGHLELDLYKFSDMAAKYLSEHDGVVGICINSHMLNGDEVAILRKSARFFSRYDHSNISPPSGIFLGARVLTKEIADQFMVDDLNVKIDGEPVFIDDFTEIDDEAAQILVSCYCNDEMEYCPNFPGDLNLNGLIELKESTAAILSRALLDLQLNGLTEISDEAAANLSRFECCLQLNGLKDLSDEAAKSLAVIEEHNLFLPNEISDRVSKFR